MTLKSDAAFFGCDPERYARLKSQAGQMSLFGDTPAGEHKTPQSLFEQPAKPTAKPAEPKPAAASLAQAASTSAASASGRRWGEEQERQHPRGEGGKWASKSHDEQHADILKHLHDNGHSVPVRDLQQHFSPDEQFNAFRPGSHSVNQALGRLQDKGHVNVERTGFGQERATLTDEGVKAVTGGVGAAAASGHGLTAEQRQQMAQHTPHMLTSGEWSEASGKPASEHKQHVQRAVDAGASVPEHVMAEYPGMRPAHAQQDVGSMLPQTPEEKAKKWLQDHGQDPEDMTTSDVLRLEAQGMPKDISKTVRQMEMNRRFAREDAEQAATEAHNQQRQHPSVPDVFGGLVPPSAPAETAAEPSQPAAIPAVDPEEESDYRQQLNSRNHYSDDDIRDEMKRHSQPGGDAWRLPHIKEAAAARGIDFEREAAKAKKDEERRLKHNAASRARHAAMTSAGMRRTRSGGYE